MLGEGGKFFSCQERALEFVWGMQERQRYQFLWDMWGSMTKVLVTREAPLCVSHDLQWKQPLKGSLHVVLVWAQWCEDGVSEAGTAAPVQLWMPTCLLCSCQPASGPARSTKSAQLPSLVLCYLCEVCCCWTRSSFEKLNWKIWRRLMFIRNLFCHILFHFLKCSHSAWLTASWKLLFHYCPPKIGCDFMTLMKKGSIILKNVKC